jgi:citrate lyase gamma subunit
MVTMTRQLDINSLLQKQFGENIGVEEVSPNILRIYAPFFHEDGDMLSIYLDMNSDNMLIRDFGNTLMRVAYTFDFESENKRRILDDIVKSYNGMLFDDEISMTVDESNLARIVYQFSQLVAKMSNIDVLQRELVKSLFFEYLNDFVDSSLANYGVTKNYTPSTDKSLVVDYVIKASKPIFLFGVNSDTKASKTIISCLTFQREAIPFRSLVIHENFESLTAFNRQQITNAADKQFYSFDGFKTDSITYLERETA